MEYVEEGSGGILLSSKSIESVIYRLDVEKSAALLSGLSSINVKSDIVTQVAIIASGDSSSFSTNNIEGQSGAKAGGVAEEDIDWVVTGGMTLSGESKESFIGNVELDSNGALATGGATNSLAIIIPPFYASGQVTIGGEAQTGISQASFVGAGGVHIASTNTRTSYLFVKQISCSWKRYAAIYKDINFKWNVGRLPIYWYRVIGKRVVDPCLEDCCHRVVDNIQARTLQELCEKLSKRSFKFPIETVHRFRLPAENALIQEMREAGEDVDCNPLIPVEVCDIPACAEYCVDYDIKQSIGFRVRLQVNAFYNYESNGNKIVLFGGATTKAQPNVPTYKYTATGGMNISGEAITKTNHYIGRGGAYATGTADVAHSNWEFDGGLWPEQISQVYGVSSTNIKTTSSEQPWILPERALLNDGLYTISDISYGKTTQKLVVKGFNIKLPDWAEVVDVLVNVRRSASQAGILDQSVCLIKGNDIISNNLALSNISWPLVDTTRVYGSQGWRNESSSSYDGPITRDDIISEDFGVMIQARLGMSYPYAIARIDYVSVVVTYENKQGSIVRVTGEARVKSTSQRHVASGKISTTGVAETKFGRRYVYNVPRSGVAISGISNISYDADVSNSGAILSGEAEVKPFYEVVSGGSSLSGEALVKPYSERMRGGITVQPKTALWKYNYTGSGNIIIKGGALTKDNDLKYVASGGVHTAGTIDVKSSYFNYVGSGAVHTGGNALQRGSSITFPYEKIKMNMKVLQSGVIYTDDVHVGDAVGANGTVNMCGCVTMPLYVDLTHNFAVNNILSKFLIRNNLSISKTLKMRYNVTNNSWQNNLHYKGISSDGNSQETWDIVNELQCTNILGGIEIGKNVWKLSIQFLRRNISTGDMFNTRIIVAFLPDPLCKGANNLLDLRIIYETQTGIISVSPETAVYHGQIYDNIGMFKNRLWIENQNLILRVSQIATEKDLQRIDLTQSVLDKDANR